MPVEGTGAAARLSGPGSLIAWVIVAISASCVLFSLSSLAYRFTPLSGFYALFESVFGNRIAFPLMFLYVISSIFGVATIAAGIGQYISFFDLLPVLFIEIIILTILCALNIAGIVFSMVTETILTVLKIVPLVFIALILLPFSRPENFTSLSRSLPEGCLQPLSLSTGRSRALSSAPFRLKRRRIPYGGLSSSSC